MSVASGDLKLRNPMIDRRAFSVGLVTLAASAPFGAAAVAPVQARNVVLVHGLFADGSCWLDVIARLQAKGLNVTSVQNPLTALPEAVAAATRVLDRQDGPTVFVGRSFSGMIVTEAGIHPNVSALVYVAARAPDAAEDYTALPRPIPRRPQLPASCSTAMRGGLPKRHSCGTSPAICRKRRPCNSMPCRSRFTRRSSLARPRTPVAS